MKIVSQLLFSIIFAGLLANPAMAKVYKWVDKNGVTQYTQDAPPEGKAQELKTRSTPPEAAEKNQKLKENWQKSAEEREEKKKTAKMSEEEKANREKLKEACVNAQKNIDILGNPSNRKFTENGESKYFTDEERAERLKKAKEYKETYCKDL